MKRSDILTGILFVIVLTLFITVFIIPQESLNNYDLPFVGLVVPVMGWLSFQARSDAMRGN